MDELLALRLASRGYLTTSDALDHVDRATLDRLVRRDELTRVRAGVYVDGRRLASADPVSRHVLVVRAAASVGIRAGVVAADAALRQGMDRAELAAALRRACLGRGRRTAARVVLLADGRSESPGESWLRLVMAEVDLPTPEPQALLEDESGAVIARVDFLFRHERVVVELDGAVKYGGAGPQGQLALVAEKHREDAIRRLGYVVVRLTWADLRSPERVRALIRAAIRVAAA